MLRKIPPLEAAEAFIAAARAENMRAAADALALSTSAVSRRVQTLEDFVGAKLFLRKSRGLSLTPDGRRYLEQIELVMDALGEATLALRGKNESFKVAASHTIASEWLMPRAQRLEAETEFPMEIIVGDPLKALKEQRADFALCGGFAPPEGFHTRPLTGGATALLAAPIFAADHRWKDLKLVRPKFPAMNPEQTKMSVQERGIDIDLERLARIPSIVFDTLQMAYEAAANCMGFALAVPLASERFLAGGRTRICSDARCEVRAGYWLAERRETHPLKDFRRKRVQDWLVQEALQSQHRFDESIRAS